MLELGRARVIELIAVFRLLKRPLSTTTLLIQRLLSSTLALKALKLLSPNSIIRSLILY